MAAAAAAAAAATLPAPPPQASSLPPPRPLPYDALRAATAGWHPLAVIGEGGFGTVYRGVIDLGGGLAVPVAIKRQQQGGRREQQQQGQPQQQQQQQQQGEEGQGQQGGAEFAAEVALLRRLQHPNLVRLVGWCDCGGGGGGGGGGSGPAFASCNPFAATAAAAANANANNSKGAERCLVYELCAGGSLDDALRAPSSSSSSSSRPAALPWTARLAVAAQLCSAVAALHAASPSVCHGDVKPANVLLLLADAARAAGGGMGRGASSSSAAGAAGGVTAKLADVGLAREVGGFGGAAVARPMALAAASAAEPPREALLRGDWAYLPPEARATGAVGPRSDAYALGVTLLQLATGEVEGRVHELPLRARMAAAAAGGGGGASGGGGGGAGGGGGGLAAMLDPRAGAWDAAAGERLLRVALWLCSDRAEERPTAAAAARALARLHAAGERAAEAGARRERERAEALAQAWAQL